jgi:hypothetical protein
MSAEPPTLAEQIEAIAWVATRVQDLDRRARREGEIDEMLQRLEAVIETLKHLEFMREAL